MKTFPTGPRTQIIGSLLKGVLEGYIGIHWDYIGVYRTQRIGFKGPYTILVMVFEP